MSILHRYADNLMREVVQGGKLSTVERWLLHKIRGWKLK